jgi:hypothetical protein
MYNMIFGLEELEKHQETEFESKCREVAYYQSQAERYTLDGEWSESELESDIYDVCVEVITVELIEKYKHRAMLDRDLLKHQYMAEKVLEQVGDVVELYNREYDKNRHKKVFGIVFYDEAIKRMILKNIKENLVK